MDRLIAMILKRLMNTALRKGMDAGLGHVTGKKPLEADHLKLARQAGQRASQAARIARRFLR